MVKASLKGNAGGSTEIKLNYASVVSELDNVKQALTALTMPKVDEEAYGQNKLNYTDQWLDREKGLDLTFSEYIEVVQKNIEDTISNVRTIKEQDEAIRRT